ncbi:hypothetical protein [Streptomyces sp. GQFP]|uniref:hypothetical protein n=1 Tax=Streptomyces sp. GQFP TaxID=2907545 RepID=UPI001F367B57|nr:hypothetical protein [Streptomyces sp. GQFP]UIX33445.1 hypothetical protein LUX31_27475 [Streptomyces sp. GQFP]
MTTCLYVIGLVAMCSGGLGEVSDDLPGDIADAYRRALPEALTLNDLDVYAECQSCGEPMLELPD